MGEFGSKYSKDRPIEDNGKNRANMRKFNRQKYNNYIVNNAVDEILLQENNRVSSEEEAHEHVEYEINDNDIYQINNMSIHDNK